MMKHISYIATSVDDDKTGKTKTVRSSDFKRMSYWMEDTPEFIFVHYVGNESIAVDFVHGNRTTFLKLKLKLSHFPATFATRSMVIQRD